MITLHKLKIYARYKGDVDMFGRAGRRSDQQLMDDKEWYLINTLIGDAAVINRHLGSEQRTAEATKRLLENCENEETINEIKRLAMTNSRFW